MLAVWGGWDGVLLDGCCLAGILPWQGLKPDPKKERYEKIAEKKLATPITVLCAGLPIEFQMLLSYSKNLTYYEKPNYAYCRILLRVLARAVGVCFDWRYDWTFASSQNRLKH